ncbi:hypothetical protein ES703_112523 [subsurface metagenome]
MFPDRHFELELVIHAVGFIYSQVPLDPACPQAGTCKAPVQGVLCRKGTDTYGTVHPDTVVSKELFSIIIGLSHTGLELLPPLLEVIRQVGVHSADTAKGVSQPCSVEPLEYLVDLLTLYDKIEEWRKGPKIHAKDPYTDLVICYPGKFHHDDPDELGLLRDLNTHQFLHGHLI